MLGTPRVQHTERLVGEIQVYERDRDPFSLVVQALDPQVGGVMLEEPEGGDAAVGYEDGERPFARRETPYRDHRNTFLRNVLAMRMRTLKIFFLMGPPSRFQLYDFIVQLDLYEGFVKLARASRLERMSSARHGRPLVGLPAAWQLAYLALASKRATWGN